MLAQNFKTPADLGISDAEFYALYAVLGMLEREELKHINGGNPDYGRSDAFNMGDYCTQSECGTVACIGGWAATLMGVNPESYVCNAMGNLAELYFPVIEGLLGDIRADQAAAGLRNFLTHGDPRWAEAMAD